MNSIYDEINNTLGMNLLPKRIDELDLLVDYRNLNSTSIKLTSYDIHLEKLLYISNLTKEKSSIFINKNFYKISENFIMYHLSDISQSDLELLLDNREFKNIDFYIFLITNNRLDPEWILREWYKNKVSKEVVDSVYSYLFSNNITIIK